MNFPSDDFNLFVSWLRGNTPPDTKALILAGLHIMEYGVEIGFPIAPTPLPMASVATMKVQCADAIDAHLAAHTGGKGVTAGVLPWASIFALAMQMLGLFLKMPA